MPHQVSAILLAAGSSRRMGRPKQLLPLPDQPAIRVCAHNILAAGIEDVVVVLGGPDEDLVRAALSGLPVTTVQNPHALSDMAESARIGLRSVGSSATAVLVCLVDHPLVSSATLRQLITAHAEHPDRIIIPCHRSKRGHPTLFPFPVIAGIVSGGTLRDIIQDHRDAVETMDVEDEGVVLDMDTEEEYEAVRRRLVKH